MEVQRMCISKHMEMGEMKDIFSFLSLLIFMRWRQLGHIRGSISSYSTMQTVLGGNIPADTGACHSDTFLPAKVTILHRCSCIPSPPSTLLSQIILHLVGLISVQNHLQTAHTSWDDVPNTHTDVNSDGSSKCCSDDVRKIFWDVDSPNHQKFKNHLQNSDYCPNQPALKTCILDHLPKRTNNSLLKWDHYEQDLLWH